MNNRFDPNNKGATDKLGKSGKSKQIRQGRSWEIRMKSPAGGGGRSTETCGEAGGVERTEQERRLRT